MAVGWIELSDFIINPGERSLIMIRQFVLRCEAIALAGIKGTRNAHSRGFKGCGDVEIWNRRGCQIRTFTLHAIVLGEFTVNYRAA